MIAQVILFGVILVLTHHTSFVHSMPLVMCWPLSSSHIFGGHPLDRQCDMEWNREFLLSLDRNSGSEKKQPSVTTLAPKTKILAPKTKTLAPPKTTTLAPPKTTTLAPPKTTTLEPKSTTLTPKSTITTTTKPTSKQQHPNCHCPGKTCNDKGGCINGALCEDGWYGPFCQYACEPGTWGQGCAQKCHGHCHKRTCDPISGLCDAGCIAGFKSPECTQGCLDGTYGQDCGQNCSQFCIFSNTSSLPSCHSVNGSCLFGCQDGYEGPTCRDFKTPVISTSVLRSSNSANNIVLVSGVLCAALLAIFVTSVFIVVYRKKLARKQSYIVSEEFSKYDSGTELITSMSME